MRKFAEKEYENTKKLLDDIHIHPETILYKTNNNDVLEKFYNWFNNNSYGFVDLLINSEEALDDIFYKIFTDVQNIQNKNVNEENFHLKLNRLKNYYNKIENKSKDFMSGDAAVKRYLINIINDILLNDSEKLEININEVKEKLKQYYIKVDIASKDLTLRAKESINNIERDRTDFNKTLEIYKKDISDTKEKLIKQYDDLNKNHVDIINKIYKDINDIQNSVNREQLAAYFFNERKKLKGDINIVFLFFAIIVTVIFINVFGVKFFILNNIKDINDVLNINLFMDLGLVILIYLCAFLVVYSGYVFYKNQFGKNDTKLEYFQELKNLLTPYWCWLGLTFAGMFTILRISYVLFILNLQNLLPTEPYKVLTNLPFFMILVWFTWFCSKQFSYTKQICDEYEYKYALSKSYLSYRDEAKNVSANDKGKYDAIMVALLDSVIKNIATSPVKSVKPDCHTPFTEVFGSLKDITKHSENKNS